MSNFPILGWTRSLLFCLNDISASSHKVDLYGQKKVLQMGLAAACFSMMACSTQRKGHGWSQSESSSCSHGAIRKGLTDLRNSGGFDELRQLEGRPETNVPKLWCSLQEVLLFGWNDFVVGIEKLSECITSDVWESFALFSWKYQERKLRIQLFNTTLPGHILSFAWDDNKQSEVNTIWHYYHILPNHKPKSHCGMSFPLLQCRGTANCIAVRLCRRLQQLRLQKLDSVFTSYLQIICQPPQPNLSKSNQIIFLLCLSLASVQSVRFQRSFGSKPSNTPAIVDLMPWCPRQQRHTSNQQLQAAEVSSTSLLTLKAHC